MGLLDKISDLVMWVLETFKRPDEETAPLKEIDTESGHFLSETPKKLMDVLDSAKSPGLEKLMGSVGFMLAGEVERASSLLNIIFSKVLAKGTATFEATAAFPEMQFWFVRALKKFSGLDSGRIAAFIERDFWGRVFSPALMFVGKEDGCDVLPATTMHVLLRQQIVELVLEFVDVMDARKAVLDRTHADFAGSVESPCLEEHAIHAEVAASVLSKLALECYSLTMGELQSLPTFLVESKKYKDRLVAVQDNPTYSSIRIRYSTARSGMMNSIVNIILSLFIISNYLQ